MKSTITILIAIIIFSSCVNQKVARRAALKHFHPSRFKRDSLRINAPKTATI